MSRKKEIIRQSSVYSVSTLITQVITVIAAFLTRRFLGPTQMGVWSTLQVIVDYSKYAVLGAMSAVSVEIPYGIGRGEIERTEKIKNTAFTFVTVSSLVFSGAVAVFAVLTHGRFSIEVTMGLYFVAAIVFIQRISNLLVALLRCYKRFDIESGQMIWSAVVNALLIALLASRFKIYGFIWALGLSLIFNIVYLLRRYQFNFQWCFDRAIFQPLVARGFPLMLLGVMTTSFQSIDRIVIAKMLGFELLGMYSIALMACSFVGNFFSAANIVLVPHFQEKFGQTDTPDHLRDFLFNSALPFAMLMPILIVCGWLFAPYFVRWLLPKFVPGIPAMKLLLLGSFFSAMTLPYQNFLITIKKHMLIFPILLFAIASALGLSWLAVHAQRGIEGVAVAMAFSSFVIFASSYGVAVKMFSDGRFVFRRFLVLLSFFVYMLVFLGVESLFAVRISGLALRMSVKCALFVAFSVPLLYTLNKRFSFVRLLLGRFFRFGGAGSA